MAVTEILCDPPHRYLKTNAATGKKATAEDYDLWLLDNTAFRPVNEDTYKLDPWQAEFVAAYFHKGRKDLTKAVSNIVDTIGLDGDVGSDPEVLKTIEERLGPFVQAIAPARTCEIIIPSPGGPFHTRKLGPSSKYLGQLRPDAIIVRAVCIKGLFQLLSPAPLLHHRPAQLHFTDPGLQIPTVSAARCSLQEEAQMVRTMPMARAPLAIQQQKNTQKPGTSFNSPVLRDGLS